VVAGTDARGLGVIQQINFRSARRGCGSSSLEALLTKADVLVFSRKLAQASCRVAPDTRGTFLQYQVVRSESNSTPVKLRKSCTFYNSRSMQITIAITTSGSRRTDFHYKLCTPSGTKPHKMYLKDIELTAKSLSYAFHLILQPMLVIWFVSGRFPAKTASSAARKSLPVNGISFPPPDGRFGRLLSSCPR
jgi:hypothetical protein